MIQAVIFDLGKVLVDFDYGIALNKLAKSCRVSLAEVRKFIEQSPLLFDYETGLVSNAEFFQKICDVTGYCGAYADFRASFGDIFTPIQPMIDLQAALRKRGFPTYIFSNTNEIAVSHIRRHFLFFSNFDGYVLSYEHRAMKPDPKLYEVVERMSGRRGRDLLYLDDRPENIAAGAARGWRVILQESPEKAIVAVKGLGLL